MTWRRQWQLPLQYSCLENPMDRGAWWAAVHGVTKESETKQQHNHSLYQSFTCLSLYFLRIVSYEWNYYDKEHTHFKAWNIDFQPSSPKSYQFTFQQRALPCSWASPGLSISLLSLLSQWHLYNNIALILCEVFFIHLLSSEFLLLWTVWSGCMQVWVLPHTFLMQSRHHRPPEDWMHYWSNSGCKIYIEWPKKKEWLKQTSYFLSEVNKTRSPFVGQHN